MFLPPFKGNLFEKNNNNTINKTHLCNPKVTAWIPATARVWTARRTRASFYLIHFHPSLPLLLSFHPSSPAINESVKDVTKQAPRLEISACASSQARRCETLAVPELPGVTLICLGKDLADCGAHTDGDTTSDHVTRVIGRRPIMGQGISAWHTWKVTLPSGFLWCVCRSGSMSVVKH